MDFRPFSATRPLRGVGDESFRRYQRPNAIVVELAYTAAREAAPFGVWGFDSPRWHWRDNHEEEEETKVR